MPSRGGLDNDMAEGKDRRRVDVMLADDDDDDDGGGSSGGGDGRTRPLMRNCKRRGLSTAMTNDISRDTASMLQRSQSLVARAKVSRFFARVCLRQALLIQSMAPISMFAAVSLAAGHDTLYILSKQARPSAQRARTRFAPAIEETRHRKKRGGRESDWSYSGIRFVFCCERGAPANFDR